MQLRARPRVSGTKAKPRATSPGLTAVDKEERASVTHITFVKVSSSTTGTTPGSGELPLRVSSVSGGGARLVASLPRSESAGTATWPPEDPSRRSAVQMWGRCNADGDDATSQQSALAISWDPIPPPEEGTNFTLYSAA